MARTSASTDRPRRFLSVRLLIAKGIFTEDEYADVLNDGLEREVKRYELELSERRLLVYLGITMPFERKSK